MSKKLLKVVAPSLAAIAVAGVIVGGSTYALFTSNDEANIAITSGKISVVASLESLNLYSPSIINMDGSIPEDATNTATATNFGFGGTASISGGVLSLNKMIPGDKANFDLRIKNLSDVSVKYRLTITTTSDNGLMSSLTITIGSGEAAKKYAGASIYTTWTGAEPESEDIVIPVSVELPGQVGDDYQDKSCSIRFAVEAVQANANVTDELAVVSELNQTLAASSKVNKTPYDAVNEVGGESVFTEIPGMAYGWVRSVDQFIAFQNDTTSIDVVDTYVLVNPTTIGSWGNCSKYLMEGEYDAVINTTKGIDVGSVEGITSISYSNSGDAQDVIIRTNNLKTNISVSAPEDEVYHYDLAGEVTLISVKDSSYHENGTVGFMEINKGHVVVEENASVDLMYANPQDATTTVKVTNKGDVDHSHAASKDVASNVNNISTDIIFDYNDNVEQNEIDNIYHHVDNQTAVTGSGSKTDSNYNIANDKEIVINELVNVAKIDNVYYETLAEAISSVSTNETIILLKDIVDAGEIVLPANVNLDGEGHAISGDSCVKVNAAGSIIKNVVFKDIHNTKTPSADDITKYGLPADKVGTLSGIYASKLTGSLTITDCTFDTADWEAIQITPLAGSSIKILRNTFKNTSEHASQLRYVHIEQTESVVAANVSIVINNNKFYKAEDVNAKPAAIANIGIYRVTKETCNLADNYFEYEGDQIRTNSFVIPSPDYANPTNYIADTMPTVLDSGLTSIVPASYSENIVFISQNTAPVVQTSSSGGTTFNSIAEAMAAGKYSLYLKRNYSENITVPAGKTLSLYLKDSKGSYTLGGTITNNGTVSFGSGDNPNSTVVVNNNGTVKLGSIAATGVTIYGGKVSYTVGRNTAKTVYGVYDLSKAVNAQIEITTGYFSTKPNDDFLKDWYIANEITEGEYAGVYSVEKMTDEQANAAGAVVYTVDASKNHIYYHSIEEALVNKTTSQTLYMNDDIDGIDIPNTTIAVTINTNNRSLTGSIQSKGNITVIGNVELTSVKCASFIAGSASIISIETAELTKNITISAGSTLTINNATVAGTITARANSTFVAKSGTFEGQVDTLEEGATLKFYIDPTSIVDLEKYSITETTENEQTVWVVTAK